MDARLIQTLAEELHSALDEHRVVEPLSVRHPGISIADAYAIQQLLTARRVGAGERIVGRKIGVTSQAVMTMLGVDQPDFGTLFDTMQHVDGGTVSAASLIQPKAEAEIAFRLKRDLQGPGVMASDVLAATDCVMACFEVVDSRIRDWRIRIQDTVADNASCGVFVLNATGVDPRDVDLLACPMQMEKNGIVVASGNGKATMGSPLEAVAWLANELGRLGVTLRAGEIVLSGALGAMVPVVAGDRLNMNIGGIGACSISFD